MRTGRPPAPIEAKRRRGTLRADRTPPILTAVVPVDIRRVADGPIITALVDSGAAQWIAETDMPTVRLAQRLWDDMELLRAALDDQFDPKAHAAYMATVKELRSCLSMLGLSPSDRTRVGASVVQARSKLEELMDRRGRRDGTSTSRKQPSAPATEPTF